jgi:hypothetical protein
LRGNYNGFHKPKKGEKLIRTCLKFLRHHDNNFDRNMPYPILAGWAERGTSVSNGKKFVTVLNSF